MEFLCVAFQFTSLTSRRPIYQFLCRCYYIRDYADYITVRLENEHIGNTDQYRVTREVPLPYNFDGAVERDTDDEGEDDEDRNARFSVQNSWRQRSVRLARMSNGDNEAPSPTRESRMNPGA